MWRRLMILTAGACLTLTNTGCFINFWASDPNRRMQQMMNVSENLRQVQDEWDRIWQVDQPSHLTPVRVHGGIGY